MTQPFQGFAPQQPVQQFAPQPQQPVPQNQPFSQQQMPQQQFASAPSPRQVGMGLCTPSMNQVQLSPTKIPPMPIGAHILSLQSIVVRTNRSNNEQIEVVFGVLESNVPGEVGQLREWFRFLTGNSPYIKDYGEKERKALSVALLGWTAESPELKAHEAAGTFPQHANANIVPGSKVRCDVTLGKPDKNGKQHPRYTFSPA